MKEFTPSRIKLEQLANEAAETIIKLANDRVEVNLSEGRGELEETFRIWGQYNALVQEAIQRKFK